MVINGKTVDTAYANGKCVYTNTKYPDGYVVFESNIPTGEITIDLLDNGVYEVICVGGGGGSCAGGGGGHQAPSGTVVAVGGT